MNKEVFLTHRVDKKNGVVIVTANMKIRKLASEARISISTPDIKKYLENKEIKFTTCLKHASVTNIHEHRLNGEWTFGLVVEVVAPIKEKAVSKKKRPIKVVEVDETS